MSANNESDKKSVAARLVAMAQERYLLGVSEDGEPFGADRSRPHFGDSAACRKGRSARRTRLPLLRRDPQRRCAIPSIGPETLLEWDGWKAKGREFIESHRDGNIDIVDVIAVYSSRLREFSGWFWQQIEDSNRIEILEYRYKAMEWGHYLDVESMVTQFGPDGRGVLRPRWAAARLRRAAFPHARLRRAAFPHARMAALQTRRGRRMGSRRA